MNANQKLKGKQKNISVESFQQMSDTDSATAHGSASNDSEGAGVQPQLADREQRQNFIRQTEKPYCSLDNDIVVKVNFEGACSIEESISSYIMTVESQKSKN